MEKYIPKQPPQAKRQALDNNILQYVSAIQLPNINALPRTFFLLFHSEKDTQIATDLLKDYTGSGFALILEKTNTDRATLKFHEPDTDTFYTSQSVFVRTNALEAYSDLNCEKTYFSIGTMLIKGSVKITHVEAVRVPVVSFLVTE